MVASDLFELAASALLEINDSNAITDKLRRNALLIEDLRDQSPFGSHRQANWFRRGDFTWNHQSGPHFRPPDKGCQVITPYFRPKRGRFRECTNLDFSVQPLCSLCLRGYGRMSYHNHRGTENTEVTQRRSQLGHHSTFPPFAATFMPCYDPHPLYHRGLEIAPFGFESNDRRRSNYQTPKRDRCPDRTYAGSPIRHRWNLGSSWISPRIRRIKRDLSFHRARRL